MVFGFDGSPEVRDQVCTSCGRAYEWVMGMLTREGDAFAVYYAQCHGHGAESEVWMDVVLGCWDEPAFTDHATFACRVSPNGVGAVDAPVASKGAAAFSGAMLTRQAALNDPRIGDVWAAVDFISTQDPIVSARIYGSA